MANQYSKKLLEHFFHPRNMGKIKNADAIATVGNPTCLLPKQNIHINNDLKEISKISRGDKVLSHDGQYNKVNRVVEKNYNGMILEMKNKLGKISLTPEHLLWAIRIPQDNKFLWTRNRKKLFPAWCHATDLRKGDIILYPILKEKKETEYIKIDVPRLKWDFKSKKIPEKIFLNSDLLRLFGYYLAEGNVRDKPCKTYISLAFNISEEKIAKNINKICKALFGLNVVIRKIPERKTIIVDIYSARLARFFKKLFGSGAANKSIPDFIMNLPAEKQKSLIYGLWKGDGYVNLNRDGPRGGYSTISYRLAQQLKVLLLRQKITPSVYIDKERENKGIKHRKAYRLHVGQRDSLLKLCSILNIKYSPQSYISEKAWFDDDCLYIPITGIKKRNYNGKVCNLEVKKSHSFTSAAFCLHNCGDVLKLYLKIKNNKIIDIKFETLGCAAAIGVSSVLTEMVKGKTIKEAIKVKSQDIIDQLGGVPLAKVHCSVLGEQALKKAIKNWQEKK